MTNPSFRERARTFWSRHRSLFWMLHSGWALGTGILVVYLARERYGLVPWVVGFLVLTWSSTLYFGGRGEGPDGSSDGAPTLGDEVTSYATRTLYQETLFFLLPLYAHSTVPGSPNVVFLLLLSGLAVISCIDLVFDRWLRLHPIFGLLFFSTVAFAAINLLLPLLLGTDPRIATPLAAALAVGSAVPLVLRAPSAGRWARARLGVAGVAFLVVAFVFQSLVPPVPLRAESVTFAASIDPETLELGPTLGSEASVGLLDTGLYVLVEVFAPSSVPARVDLQWKRDGTVIRTSRAVEIVAHDWGFRVWDGWSPSSGRPSPGRYTVAIRTGGRRVFGSGGLTITDSRDERPSPSTPDSGP